MARLALDMERAELLDVQEHRILSRRRRQTRSSGTVRVRAVELVLAVVMVEVAAVAVEVPARVVVVVTHVVVLGIQVPVAVLEDY